MRNTAGVVLYVGKAKNLKKRLSSYFNKQLDNRLSHLVANIAHIDVTITASEKEALLLENSLIKSFSPKYNIIFKDDKFYPYLFLSQATFPRLIYHRGAKNLKGRYFGPYPSALSVKVVLELIQKMFKLRQCSDAFFYSRSRPCLQYQIKRCSAPCVNYITPEQYQLDVEAAKNFLQGDKSDIVTKLITEMNQAAEQHDFELAANLRDKISHVRQVQEKQHIYVGHYNVDVIALTIKQHQACVQVLFIRAGAILDSKSYFVGLAKNQIDLSSAQIMQQFIFQHYIESQIKQGNIDEIILSEIIEDHVLVQELLEEKWNKKNA